MKPLQPRFSELFISKSLDLRFLAELRRSHPDSRSLYWDPQLCERRDLELAISMAERVVVQDGLMAPLDSAARSDECEEVEFEGFSQFDKELARKLDQTLRGQVASSAKDAPAEVFEVERGPVLFCPSNDTHTKLFDPIARHLSSSQFLLHDRRPEERAREMMESLGISCFDGGAESLEELRPSVIVVGNDWYDGAWELFERAYALGIPTVCIQEGCLDFETHARMRYCDYAFIQGPVMLDHVTATSHFMSGNPRFDSIATRPLPEHPVVMLNCNFTYGVEEGNREAWIGEISSVCRQLETEYFISQHPRDRGVFPNDPVRRSHAGVVHEHVADSSVLVTRFSTLVYEAMRAGRRVVYYNPHGETMRLFNEDETGGIFKAHDRASLHRALVAATKPACEQTEARRASFMNWHCGANDGRAAYRTAGGLAAVSNAAESRTGNNRRDWLAMWGWRRRASLAKAVRTERSRVRRVLSSLKQTVST